MSDLDPLFSSAKNGGSDDWPTPEWLYNKITRETNLGRPFVLDPCADATNKKCVKFYTIEDDGLKQPWAPYGKVFVNPPYSKVKNWVKKSFDESKLLKELDDVIVLLIPARTDTTWWHDYVAKAAQIYFLKGRVKFGDAKNSAPFPSAVVVFRPYEAFKKVNEVHFVDWRLDA